MRVDSAEKVGSWLGSVGAHDVAVTTFARDVPVTPGLAWQLCTGSAARTFLDGLDDAAVVRVRERYAATLAADTFAIRALIATGARSTP